MYGEKHFDIKVQKYGILCLMNFKDTTSKESFKTLLFQLGHIERVIIMVNV